jgi:hypothetical protein
MVTDFERHELAAREFPDRCFAHGKKTDHGILDHKLADGFWFVHFST